MAKQKRETKKAAKPPMIEWQVVRRWIVALMLFAVMGSGAAWGVIKLQDPNMLPVKVVRIDGDFRHLKRTDLERAVGDRVIGNFFTIDVDAVREDALALPWVDQVTVRRVWPDTLMMWVDEQVPLARWGKARLVNARGQVFAPDASSIPSGLPRLDGPDENAAEVVKRYGEIMELTRQVGLDVEQVKMDPRSAWYLRFADGLELQLGSVDTEQRLHRFVSAYRQLVKVATGKARRVDMRYTNGLAVYWEKSGPQRLEGPDKPAADVKSERNLPAGRGQV
ncbi:MAG: cell division protein FtsQ/DivIB [Sedimenticola sp.]